MSSTLIDSVRSVFTEPVLSKFSLLLGEPIGNIQKAVHGAIPMILTDIVHKSYYQESTVRMGELSRQAAASDFFGSIHELSTGSGGLVPGSLLLNKGTDFAKALLSTRTDLVISEISRYAGINIPSASFITGIVSFASLDAIGRHMAGSNTDAARLAPWLKTQADSTVRDIPAGLQVKQALGINQYPWEKPVRRSRNTVLYTIVALLILGIIIFTFYRYRQHADTAALPVTTDTVAATTPSAATPSPATSAAPATTGTDTVASFRIRVSLPNGKVLTAYKGGTEDRLVNFLNDPNARLDKDNGNWFDFTRIGFASNSSALLLESAAQLKNIVAILGAFPKAKIKIGSYSDNTGDSVNNVRLSQQRADNILSKLKGLGAKHAQLAGAKGYGSNYPVGDNGTATGRMMNRRMSIDVKAK
jgi:outer membrane protein OmpA-like peptidoglycan-associated protein